MPHIPCKKCDKIFYSKPSWIKKGGGKYCSKYCYSQARKKGRVIKCFTCGKETYKQLKELNKSKDRKFFCGMRCSLQWHNSTFIGSRHPNWIHGEYSYREVMKRNKIVQVCALCKSNNKKVIIVHHIDKNRKNNTIKNLTWLCRNCHFLVHNYENENKRLRESIS